MSLFPIKIPSMGESISEAIVAKMLKKPGDLVRAQEEILELETDKVNQVISSPIAGKLHWQVHEGDRVKIGQVIAQVDPKIAAEEESDQVISEKKPKEKVKRAKVKPTSPERPQPLVDPSLVDPESFSNVTEKLICEENEKHEPTENQPEIAIDTEKLDIKLESAEVEVKHVENGLLQSAAKSTEINPSALSLAHQVASPSEGLKEKRTKLSSLKRTMANRLLQSQLTTATLTTFNEIDMSEVMKCREHYKEDFFKRHGVKLGLMSFFTKAIVQALEKVPSVGSRIEGEDWIEPLTYDIGIAVSTERGLLVPVLRACERLSLAEIEKALFDVASRAREAKVRLEELTGGCFTISNAGVFGSLLSTPILNPPQSAILGMHKIEKRPVVIEGDQIAVRPMMYVALSYDHRVIDGKDAVSFLVDVKESIEQPERMLLDI